MTTFQETVARATGFWYGPPRGIYAGRNMQAGEDTAMVGPACLSTSSHRRDDRDCRLATARSSLPVAPTRASVSALWLPGRAAKQSSGRGTTWGSSTWCPRDLVVPYSQHYCTQCRKYFSADISDLAPPGSQYTHRVIDLAVRWWSRTACPTGRRAGTSGATTASSSPCHHPELGRGGGEKAQARGADFLTGPWPTFPAMWRPTKCTTGPSAFCRRSITAGTSGSSTRFGPRPTHDDILAFLGRLKMALAARNLTPWVSPPTARRSTPAPHGGVGDVPHQICTFHVLAEVGKAVLGADASARKGLAATEPKLPRGRPSTPRPSRQPAPSGSRARRRVVRASASVRPTSPEQSRRKTLWR